MKKHEFQKLVDQNLSSLVWDERSRARVWHAIGKEERPVKKISTTFILVAAILCISVAALATGLLFSPRYEAGKAANHAMEEQYGITADLLSLFRREVTEHGDGTATVTYSAPVEDFPAEQMGSYIVQVNGSKASVSWSNEGKDTSGGLLAEAFGPEQLRLLSCDYANTMQQLLEAGVIAPKASAGPTPNLQLQESEIVWTEDHQAAADVALDMARLADEKRLAELSQAETMGRISIQTASEMAKEAVCQEYELSAAQQKHLTYEPDSTYAVFDGSQPMVSMLFWLWQREDGPFSEKDGQYWVTINLNSGIIEEILYDAGLAGNG